MSTVLLSLASQQPYELDVASKDERQYGYDQKTAVSHHELASDTDSDQARAAVTAEKAAHSEGAWQALKTHPKAAVFSVCISLALVMEGYDLNLIGNLIAQDAFRERYGTLTAAGYQIPAPWQTALGFAAQLGSFFGVLISGTFINRIGYRYTHLIAYALLVLFVFICFFAVNLPMLFIGTVLCGVPWGMFVQVAPAYAAELAPLSLVSIMTVWVQTAIVIGALVNSGVMYACSLRTDQWAYKIPLGIQWVWPIPLAAAAFWCPESPWWLVRVGRLQEAERVVKRLGVTTGSTAKAQVAMMIRTHEIEIAQSRGASYGDCFRGPDLRRTLICSFVYGACVFSGLLIANYSVYFYQQAGINSATAFKLGFISSGLSLACGICSWFLLPHVGRRTLYLWGVGCNIICLLAIGILSLFKSQGGTWAIATFCMLITIQYSTTIGPMTYSIFAEVPSVRLRALTVGIGKCVFVICLIVTVLINSYALNPSAWNLGPKTAFIWFSTGVCIWVVAFFGVPELKDRTFRELDLLFIRGVPARKFPSTVVEEEADV